MTHQAHRDLEAWIPRLLALWRSNREGRHQHQHPRSPARRADAVPQATLTKDELAQVSAGVRELSLGLTRKRALVGARYMDDVRLLGAYLLFYWPVSYAQARALLRELPARPRSLLDLGSGPGPVAFAVLDAGAREVVAADRSTKALDLAKALAAEASEPLSAREWTPDKPLPQGQFDLITMGHVLNELFSNDMARRADFVERVAERLTKGGTMLILEPALRETSRGLLQVRDALISRGFSVRAPCLFRGPCPALVKDSDWCHAEQPWQPPALVDAISKAAGLHKESLKMSYLMLTPRGETWPEPPPGRLFRIVSEPLEGKGRQRYMGCGPEGRMGLALQDKHHTAANEAFAHLNRGEVIRVTHTEARGDGLALTQDSSVEIVSGRR